MHSAFSLWIPFCCGFPTMNGQINRVGRNHAHVRSRARPDHI
jgi:hypothetical protein